MQTTQGVTLGVNCSFLFCNLGQQYGFLCIAFRLFQLALDSSRYFFVEFTLTNDFCQFHCFVSCFDAAVIWRTKGQGNCSVARIHVNLWRRHLVKGVSLTNQMGCCTHCKVDWVGNHYMAWAGLYG